MMKTQPSNKKKPTVPPSRGLIWLSIFVLFLCLPINLLAQDFRPSADRQAAHSARSLTQSLEKFLGIPFLVDGAQNQDGRWVTFNEPDLNLGSPGFNCSGFTVAAARELLGRNFSLTEAGFDRRGDSGPGAELGQDWDFGLDLILNLAEAYPHRYLPEPENPDESPRVFLRPGRSLGWGVSIHSPDFERILKQINPGNFCFFVFSRPDKRFPAGLSYYHVGVIIPEGQAMWLYHVTKGAKTSRIDIGSRDGLARLRRYFKPIENGERRVFMIEVSPPQ